MVDVVGILANWLFLSALYALVALGFTLIFGVAGDLNLAHGALIAVGAYAGYGLWASGASIWFSTLLAAAVAGMCALLLYELLVSRLHGDHVITMIATLLAGMAIEEGLLASTGSTPKSVPSLVQGQLEVARVTLRANRVAVFVLSWVLIGLLFAFVRYTSAGRALVALSNDRRGAALVGIDRGSMARYTWLGAGALAGIAGVFLASFQSASPFMGREPLLLSFAIVILGGIGSLRGSVLGAYIIGFLEVTTISLFSPRFSSVTAFLVLIAVLLYRPQGLWGRQVAG